MNIAIVGYGRMGQMVHRLLESSEIHKVSAIIDPIAADNVTASSVSFSALDSSDAVIDFSYAEAAAENMLLYSQLDIPAVIGTTGWYDDLCRIKDNLDMKKARIIYSGNFSIGVQIFLHLAEEAGRMINGISSYDISVSEVHHREKADSPSGTALMTANKLLQAIDRKRGLQIGNPDGKIEKDLISVSSSRTGFVPGIHTVMIDGPADTIEITHTARSREGFAEGAIRAAEWIVKQPVGLYTMDDFVQDLIGGR